MQDDDVITRHFEEHRPELRAVAYRMLGSATEADDAVQEAWLRLQRTDATDVDNLGAWLTTVVSRVCLNVLRARAVRRAEPLDDVVEPPAGHGRVVRRRPGPRTRPCSPTRSGSPSSSCSTR